MITVKAIDCVRKMGGWFVVMWNWAKIEPVAWVGIVLLIASFHYAAFDWGLGFSGEARVRYAGTVLQLGGVVMVALGVGSTRKMFGLPGTARAFWNWLSEIPLGGPRTVSEIGRAHV